MIKELSDATGTPAQKIYEHKLRKIAGVGEISFAIRHGRHLLDEIHQIIIARQHERVDHYTGFATGLNLFERLGHDQRVAGLALGHHEIVGALAALGPVAGDPLVERLRDWIVAEAGASGVDASGG